MLCDPRDRSPPGSSVRGILQARTLGWGAISFSSGSFEPRSPALQLASFRLSPREAWPLLTQVWFSLTEGGLPWCSGGKESARSAEDPGLIPKLGRSPGEGNGTPLQYSCLEDPMDRGAWWATVHGVAKQLTLSLYSFSLTSLDTSVILPD